MVVATATLQGEMVLEVAHPDKTRPQIATLALTLPMSRASCVATCLTQHIRRQNQTKANLAAGRKTAAAATAGTIPVAGPPSATLPRAFRPAMR